MKSLESRCQNICLFLGSFRILRDVMISLANIMVLQLAVVIRRVIFLITLLRFSEVAEFGYVFFAQRVKSAAVF